MFLWWPSSKIVQAIMIRQKTWPPRGGAYFPYISIKKILKVFLLKTTWLIFQNIRNIRPSYFSCIKLYKTLLAVNLGECANLFAQVSNIGPSWSSCFRILFFLFSPESRLRYFMQTVCRQFAWNVKVFFSGKNKKKKIQNVDWYLYLAYRALRPFCV